MQNYPVLSNVYVSNVPPEKSKQYNFITIIFLLDRKINDGVYFLLHTSIVCTCLVTIISIVFSKSYK